MKRHVRPALVAIFTLCPLLLVLGSIIAQPQGRAELEKQKVFVTNTGKKYHREGCRYLAKSSIPTTLGEAVRKYGPCSVCRPPTLEDDLLVQPAAVPQAITLIEGNQPKVPTCLAGAVRFRLLPPEFANRTCPPGEAVLVFEVTAEPRLKIVRIEGMPILSKAIDDQKQKLAAVEQEDDPLPIAMPNVRLRKGIGGFNQQSASIPVLRLKLGDKLATNLKELTGNLVMQVESASEPGLNAPRQTNIAVPFSFKDIPLR